VTYAQFLLIFLVLPILLLAGAVRRRWRQRYGLVVGLHSLIALAYTTPWDNYLVATRVWWYDPGRVMGITWGWVPLEEYTFFVLQPILVGLWLIYLSSLSLSSMPWRGEGMDRAALRWGATLGGGLIWLGALAVLVFGWRPGTYLGLELGWLMPPILLQLAFGADILWRYRRPVIWAIATATFYLAGADALAIRSGIWTIDPDQSLGILLGGVLPWEEFVFFALTNVLIVFGITLLLSAEGRGRAQRWWGRWRPAREP